MYKVRYRIWADDGLVDCEGMADCFTAAAARAILWLDNNAVYAEIARIEFERIDDVPNDK